VCREEDIESIMLKVDQLLLQKNIPNGNLERLRGAKATQRVLGESNVDISSRINCAVV